MRRVGLLLFFPQLCRTTLYEDNRVSLATLRAKLHVRHCTSIVSLFDAGLHETYSTHVLRPKPRL